jgi:hypothetical protein
MRLSWTAAIGLLVATARLRHSRAKSIKSLKVIAGVAKATGQSHTVHPDGWPAGAARRAQSPRRRPRGVPLPHEPGRAPAVRSREEMIPAPIRQRRSGDGCSAVISLPSLSPMLETEWSTFTGGASGARRERREGVTDGVWCGAPYRLALPQKRAPCSPHLGQTGGCLISGAAGLESTITPVPRQAAHLSSSALCFGFLACMGLTSGLAVVSG